MTSFSLLWLYKKTAPVTSPNRSNPNLCYPRVLQAGRSPQGRCHLNVPQQAEGPIVAVDFPGLVCFQEDGAVRGERVELQTISVKIATVSFSSCAPNGAVSEEESGSGAKSRCLDSLYGGPKGLQIWSNSTQGPIFLGTKDGGLPFRAAPGLVVVVIFPGLVCFQGYRWALHMPKLGFQYVVGRCLSIDTTDSLQQRNSMHTYCFVNSAVSAANPL